MVTNNAEENSSYLLGCGKPKSFEKSEESVILGPFMSMTDRGNGGQHFFCSIHVTEFCLKFLRQNTWER